MLTLGLSDSALSQLYLVHSTAVEFLRQFWLTYLSKTANSTRRNDLDSLAESLQNTLDRLVAVGNFAASEGGEEMGVRAKEILIGINASVTKAISLYHNSRDRHDSRGYII